MVQHRKAMTIRLPAQLAETLAAVASVDGKPIAEVIRTAISEHIAARQRDEGFRQSLREQIERTQKMLNPATEDIQ